MHAELLNSTVKILSTEDFKRKLSSHLRPERTSIAYDERASHSHQEEQGWKVVSNRKNGKQGSVRRN